MKNYILIQNDSEIETNSFELIGASTKRDEKGKIGFFGSGLKYSIAYMMRKGIDFKIYSGLNELHFTTTKEQLKGKCFERICINGKETSYTVTMGPTWKEDWYVLREIYCNALDEGDCTIVKCTENVSPTEGKTRIYIELTDVLANVIAQWDSYFADERVPLFVSGPIYTCYLGSEDDQITTQKISVFQKTNGTLYRRGIRVDYNEKRMFDYGADGVSINEDRTAKHSGAVSYIVVNLFATFADEGYIKSILRSGEDDKHCHEYGQLYTSDMHESVSDKWVEFSQQNVLVVKERAGKWAEQLQTSRKEVFLIPSLLARSLKAGQPNMNILGMGSIINDTGFNEVDATTKMNFLLKEVIKSLREMKYEVPFEIHIVEFDDDKTLGQADMEGKKIYLSSTVFDMGRREIAMTLIEETEHIKSKAADETRQFQTHIFSQWLKSMEEANGLFL
jgi:hypothetical protein